MATYNKTQQIVNSLDLDFGAYRMCDLQIEKNQLISGQNMMI